MALLRYTVLLALLLATLEMYLAFSGLMSTSDLEWYIKEYFRILFSWAPIAGMVYLGDCLFWDKRSFGRLMLTLFIVMVAFVV